MTRTSENGLDRGRVMLGDVPSEGKGRGTEARRSGHS